MYSQSANNKRIAKNSALLYFRMAIVMLLTLYISRLLLKKLGVEDFGLYGVVGGVVLLCSYLNNALVVTTQRFLNFEMSNKDKYSLIKIFSISINIHVIFSFLIILFAETIGLWFLNTHLKIPEGRIFAANCVYQLSLVCMISQILINPYYSLVNAYENFSLIAYVSVFEVILKLISVLILTYIPGDNLIKYSFFIMLVTILSRCIYVYYCVFRYHNIRYRLLWDKALSIKMLKFSSWNFLGATAGVAMNQGVDILLNMFLGPIANASRQIAFQVQNAFSNIAVNITTAVSPQIVKSYALGNDNYMYSLVNASTKYTFLILIVSMMPFIVKIDFILNLWLVEVPIWAGDFSILLLLYQLTICLTSSLNMASQASGKVMLFQIVEASILIFVLPVGWILLKHEMPATSLFFSMIFLSIVSIILKLIVLASTINFNYNAYIKEVVFPVLCVVLFCSIEYFVFIEYIFESNDDVMVNIAQMLFVLFVSALIVYNLGLSHREKIVFNNIIRKSLVKVFNR